MQLWTKEGYRNIWCKVCKKQDRCQEWRCDHKILWHECPQHRTDPEDHRTTKVMIKDTNRVRSSDLLMPERPEPLCKKARQARVHTTMMNRKRVVQSAHPSLYPLNLEMCPLLARKFPRLYSSEGEPAKALNPSLPGQDRVDEAECNEGAVLGSRPTTGVSGSVAVHDVQHSSAATGATCIIAGSSRPARTLRERGAASSS